MDSGIGSSSPRHPNLPTQGTGEIYGLLDEASTWQRVTRSSSTCVMAWGGFLPVTLHLVQSLAGLEAGDYSLGLGLGVSNFPEMPD